MSRHYKSLGSGNTPPPPLSLPHPPPPLPTPPPTAQHQPPMFHGPPPPTPSHHQGPPGHLPPHSSRDFKPRRPQNLPPQPERQMSQASKVLLFSPLNRHFFCTRLLILLFLLLKNFLFDFHFILCFLLRLLPPCASSSPLVVFLLHRLRRWVRRLRRLRRLRLHPHRGHHERPLAPQTSAATFYLHLIPWPAPPPRHPSSHVHQGAPLRRRSRRRSRLRFHGGCRGRCTKRRRGRTGGGRLLLRRSGIPRAFNVDVKIFGCMAEFFAIILQHLE